MTLINYSKQFQFKINKDYKNTSSTIMFRNTTSSEKLSAKKCPKFIASG